MVRHTLILKRNQPERTRGLQIIIICFWKVASRKYIQSVNEVISRSPLHEFSNRVKWVSHQPQLYVPFKFSRVRFVQVVFYIKIICSQVTGFYFKQYPYCGFECLNFLGVPLSKHRFKLQGFIWKQQLEFLHLGNISNHCAQLFFFFFFCNIDSFSKFEIDDPPHRIIS